MFRSGWAIFFNGGGQKHWTDHKGGCDFQGTLLFKQSFVLRYSYDVILLSTQVMCCSHRQVYD